MQEEDNIEHTYAKCHVLLICMQEGEDEGEYGTPLLGNGPNVVSLTSGGGSP